MKKSRFPEEQMREGDPAGVKAEDVGRQIGVIYSRTSDETTPAHLFVAALGASSYTYAEATSYFQMINWRSLHVRALEHRHQRGFADPRGGATTPHCVTSMW